MLQALVEETRQATSLSEQLWLLQELVAYVMQTGPKGGQFYYTAKGTKVYRKLGGKSGKARKKKKVTGEDYDKAWEKTDRAWMRQGWRSSDNNGPEMGRKLKKLFGDNAPTPDELETMFDSPELGVTAKPSGITLSGDPPRMGMRFAVYDQHGNNVGGMSRSIYKDDSDGKLTISHNSFSVRNGSKGKGIAAGVFGKAMEAYKSLGIEKVVVSAAGGGGYNGGYTWARFGFEPKDQYTVADAKDRVVRKMINEGVPPHQAHWIKRMKMRDLYTTAGIMIRVPAGGKTRAGKPKMKTIKVGKDVTKNMSWGGVFDMSDPKAVGRWNRQVAKGTAKRKKVIARSGRTA